MIHHPPRSTRESTAMHGVCILPQIQRKHAFVRINSKLLLNKENALANNSTYWYTGSAQTSLLVNYCHLLDLSADPKL